MLSPTLDTRFHTAQRLSVEDAESDSWHMVPHSSETQRRGCWVWLLNRALPRPETQWRKSESWFTKVFLQKGVWLTCWAVWFLKAWMLVSLMSHQSRGPLHSSSTLQILILLRLVSYMASHTEFLIVGRVAVLRTTAWSPCISGLQTKLFRVC